MPQGSLDLFILLLIFLGLQLYWIYPILKKNKSSIKKLNNLNENIEILERLYKK